MGRVLVYARRVLPGDRQQLVRFACVGLVGAGVNSLALWLLTERGQVYYLLSSMLATGAAILTNFVLNHTWTFAHFSSREAAGLKLAKFSLVSLGGLLVNVAVLALLSGLFGTPYLLANLGAIGLAGAWNYAANRRWTWRANHRANDEVRAQPGDRLWRVVFRNRTAIGAVIGAAMVAWVVNYLVRNLDPLGAGVFIVSVALFAQSLLSLYLMLYSWEHAGRLAASSGPRLFVAPRLSFSVILPARHEEAVIAGTIRRLLDADYPPDLIETVVVCHADDTGTIAEARRAIRELATDRVRVQTFSNGPINKPHGLNVGLACTSNEVVTIFDAEDDIDPSIFNVINTTMLQESVGIVQAGVQLMNFRDAWFAVHNVLEYFFWFKSRLHFHADVGMIPLGGNTVFVKRRLINRIGGWDEQCLTEDADLGLRLSVLGETIRVVYDPQHVTREETPASIGSLVRQRTRWHQGFLQVLRKGAWLRLPTFGQRLLAAYTLSYPLFQGILTVLWPVTVAGIVWLRLPVPVVIAAFLPLYALVFQLLISVLGIFVFSREYGLRVPLFMPLAMAVTFLPYQMLLGVSAVRAVYRELQGQNSWEKTAHLGAHRLSPEADFIPVVQPRELSHVGPEPRVRRSA